MRCVIYWQHCYKLDVDELTAVASPAREDRGEGGERVAAEPSDDLHLQSLLSYLSYLRPPLHCTFTGLTPNTESCDSWEVQAALPILAVGC